MGAVEALAAEIAETEEKRELAIERVQALDGHLEKLRAAYEVLSPAPAPAARHDVQSDAAPSSQDTATRGTGLALPPLRSTVTRRRSPLSTDEQDALTQERRDKVEQLVREHQPASFRTLLEHAGELMGSGGLTKALQELRDRSVVTTEGKTAATRYWITADRDRIERERNGVTNGGMGNQRAARLRRLEGEILAAIRGGPMTEAELATQLEADREDVADVVATLLGPGRHVELRGDGAVALRALSGV
jgi:hypothetical protein